MLIYASPVNFLSKIRLIIRKAFLITISNPLQGNICWSSLGELSWVFELNSRSYIQRELNEVPVRKWILAERFDRFSRSGVRSNILYHSFGYRKLV